MSPPDVPTFATYLDRSVRVLGEMYEDLVEHERLSFHLDGGKIVGDLEQGGPYAHVLKEAFTSGMATLVDFYLTAHLIARGPKLYRPDDDACAALEKVLPQVRLSDYRQPFPTFAVELPERFARAKAVDGARPLACVLSTLPSPSSPEAVLAAVIWSNNTSTTRSFVGAGQNVQALLAQSGGREWESSLPTTKDEQGVTEAVVRLSLNACLLLVQYGARRVGATNEKNERRLSSLLEKARKRGQPTKALARQFTSLPVVYAFERHVDLFRREQGQGHEGGEGEPTGRHVSPHWRSGHIRMQACGAGWKDHKQVYIAPVFVNAGGFKGKPSDTTTVYLD